MMCEREKSILLSTMMAKFLLMLVMILFLSASALADTTASQRFNGKAKIIQHVGPLPIYFEPNIGQVDQQVRYLSRGGNHTFFLKPHEAVLTFFSYVSVENKNINSNSIKKSPKRLKSTLRMRVQGGNNLPKLIAEDRLTSISNYIKGKDRTKWQTNIPNYNRIKYEQIYDGIDLVYYGTAGKFEYDFIVSPGVDPGIIRLQFEGANNLYLDSKGNLILSTIAGDIVQQKPIIYQKISGKINMVEGRYRVAATNEITFDVEGKYDKKANLIIDPVIDFSTFFGGSSSGDSGSSIAIDPNGNVYIAGTTGSTDLPTIYSLYPNYGGASYDAFVVKLSNDGQSILYSTFLGGDGNDYGEDISVDVNGNAYVTGHTSSSDFPVANALYSTRQCNQGDAFVLKLSSDGQTLIYSTYLGGTEGDSYGNGIVIDLNGNAHITGRTQADNFPIVNAIYPESGRYGDVFISKLSSDGQNILYSTYIPGSQSDSGEDIAVDASGNTYVTGYTVSSDFPVKNAIYPHGLGGLDAFILKISSDGQNIFYSTFLGGNARDKGNGIAVDDSGNIYVTGETISSDFPTINAIYDTLEGSRRDAFICKINSSGQNIAYSTYLGGTFYDYGSDIVVDAYSNAYVTGTTGSDNFPTVNALYPDNPNNSQSSAFVFGVSWNGQQVFYSDYLSGNGNDSAGGIAVDGVGNIYVTGTTASANFPIVNAIYPTLSGTGDTFITNISDLPRSFGYIGNLQQTPMSGSPGTTFTQGGFGFTPTSTVTLHFLNHLGQPLSPQQYATDGNGSFTLSYISPADKPIGTYSWWAVDDSTGKRSEVLGYRITESEGILSQINSPVSPVVLPPIRWGNSFTGKLTSEGSFDAGEETFVIVHGWNTSESNSLPGWVEDMGKAIRDDDTLPHVSPAQGSNILYWNWQERAKTDWDEFGFGTINGDMFKDESCTDLAIIGIPFDQTKYSGISLARALKEELPEGYNKKIHLIGHSLGSLVITYAAKSAYAHSFPYATNIDHMVYLDSPCYLGKPGQDFNKNHSDIFLENYMSSFGRDYKEADVNISLNKAIPAVGVLEAHRYAHDWYYSSVTNFSRNSILHDSSTPSITMHAGFYWWNENDRNEGKKYFHQYSNYPHYQLILDTETVASGSLDDVNGLLQAISLGLKEQIEDYVAWSGKKVSVLWTKTWASATEAEDVVVTAGHGVHNSFGFLDLTHSSTALLTIPVQIPADANSLAFGFEFLYGKSDSTLEVFIDNKAIYHTSGEMALLEGKQLTPWLKVSEYAGTTVNLNLRFSHLENGSEGKVRIDDIIIAKIETYPYGDINQDGTTDLKDTILGLQVISGMIPAGSVSTSGDINNDSRIGVEEVIYILREMSIIP